MSTVRFLLVLVIISMPLAVLAPSASAQTTEWPDASPLVVSLDHEEVVLTDAVGDTQAAAFVEFEVTADNEAEDMADILEIRVGETIDELVFSIVHDGYSDTFYGVSPLLFGSWQNRLTFGFDKDPDFKYRISFGNDRQWPPQGELFADVFRIESDDADFSIFGEWMGPVPIAFTGDAVQIAVPKDMLVVGVRERLPAVGDRIQDFTLKTEHYVAAFGFGFTDDVELQTSQSGTGHYTLRFAPGSQNIALDVALGTPEEIVTVAGGVHKVQLRVENMMERKALINMTAQALGEDGEPLADWKVVVPPTLEVRSANHTMASLIITAPGDAVHRDTAKVRVTARLLGTDDSVYLAKTVQVAQPLTPESDVLHIRSDGAASNFCIIGSILCSEETDNALTLGPRRLVLTPLIDDPEHPIGDVATGATRFDFDLAAFGFQDVGLPRETRLDPEGTIDVTLPLASDQPRNVDVGVHLLAEDGELEIGSVRRTIQLGDSPSAFEFRIVPREDSLALRASSRLGIWIEVEEELSVFGAGLSWRMDTDGAQIRFPVLPMAEADVAITDGLALPSLVFRNGTESEEYVNAGKKRVFEMALVNEGANDDVLEVRPEADQDGWSIQVQPGNRFALEPGQSAPFAVVVAAPEDAKGDEVVNINVTAKSRNDDRVHSTVRLTLIVAEGVEIPDEAYAPPPEEEQVTPFIDESEESPAGSIVALIAATIGLLAVARRPPRMLRT